MQSSFSLDFLSGVLNPAITFSRSLNTATRVNSSGLVETVNADIPRFDYNPVTLAPRGLLIEETRTNLCKYSEGVGGIGWLLQSGVTVPSTTTAPDGTTNASVLTATSADTGTRQILTGLSAATYSLSCYLKANTGTTAFIGIVNVADLVVVNLSNGTITGGTGASQATIQNAGDGWYRVTVYRACNAGNFGPSIKVRQAGAAILVWGIGFEIGEFATSYIPNIADGSTTRNADVATITGTNFSDFWQASKGGAMVQAIPSTVSGIRPLIQYDDGTANEIIALRGNTTNPELYIVDGGTPQAQLDAGTIAANTAYSLTGWWQTNNCKARKDSGAVVTDDTATIPTVTQARLGSDGTNYLNGHLATINYYDSFFGQSIYTRRKNKVVFSLL